MWVGDTDSMWHLRDTIHVATTHTNRKRGVATIFEGRSGIGLNDRRK
jgi:hypothetical protein